MFLAQKTALLNAVTCTENVMQSLMKGVTGFRDHVSTQEHFYLVAKVN